MKSIETLEQVKEAFLLALELEIELLDSEGIVTEEKRQTLSELVKVLRRLESRLMYDVNMGIKEGELTPEQSQVVDKFCDVIDQIYREAAEQHWASDQIQSKFESEISSTREFINLPSEAFKQVYRYKSGRAEAIFNHLLITIEKDGKSYTYWLDMQAKASGDLFYPINNVDDL